MSPKAIRSLGCWQSQTKSERLPIPESCAGAPNPSSSAVPSTHPEPPGSPALLQRRAWILCLATGMAWVRWAVHAKNIARRPPESDTLCWKEGLHKACLSPLSPYPNHKLGMGFRDALGITPDNPVALLPLLRALKLIPSFISWQKASFMLKCYL